MVCVGVLTTVPVQRSMCHPDPTTRLSITDAEEALEGILNGGGGSSDGGSGGGDSGEE